jgi:LAO/AO transport system kinase
VVGITGPPGAGKSTLLGALITEWRLRELTVALLAVDPSSKRSGGSLLGDRARLFLDPADRGIYVRSMASAGQLGGLAPATRAAAHALAAAFDIVVVETVGVGQSETEIAEVADTTAVIVQPASGDALQFLKSGIMEVPDVLVVTKADLGTIAQRARRDLVSTLRSIGDGDTEVVMVSSVAPTAGIPEFVEALERHRARTDLPTRRAVSRRQSALAAFAREYGERAVRELGGPRRAARLLDDEAPDLDVESLAALLAERAKVR